MTGIHWHILGVGAIGGLIAAHMEAEQRPCTLLLRDEASLAQYLAHGLTVERAGNATHYSPAAITLGGLQHRIDHLLVTTKAHQTEAALQAWSACIDPCAVLVLMQNGLGLVERIQSQWPQACLIAGSTTHGAWRKGAFDVVHAGVGSIWLGPMQQCRLTAPQAQALVESLPKASLDMRWDSSIDARLWRKFAINCAINPLTAQLGCLNGELHEHRETVHTLCEEIREVARHCNAEQAVHDLESAVWQVIDATAQNRSSMLQDVVAGRETEIHFITGHLLELAKRAGVDCPTHRALYHALQCSTPP